MVTTVTTGDYQYSFEDLAQDLKTPGTTLRRYFKVFQKFIPNKTVNRATRFDKEARQLFDDINKMYKQRMSTDEIMQTLAATRMPTLDVRPSPPPASAPDLVSLHVLAPLVGVLADLSKSFQKLVENQERMLEEMRLTRMSLEASRMPQNGAEGFGQGNVHGRGTEAKDGPHMSRADSTKLHEVRRTRQEVIAEAHRLRGLGYGAARIRTAMVRTGFPSLNGKGQLSKSTVSKIIKGEIK